MKSNKTGKQILMIALSCFCILIGFSGCTSSKDMENVAESTTQIAKEDASDPIAVSVENVTYPVSMLQRDLDTWLQTLAYTGGDMDQESRENMAQKVIDLYVSYGLMETKLHELKLDDIDKNIQYSYQEKAQEQYEQYWQAMRKNEETSDMSDEQITEYLRDNGFTVDYIYDTMMLVYKGNLLMEHYKVDYIVDEKEVDSFIEENYVNPFKERYEKNIPLYEEEVLYGQGSSFYMPEGYHMLYQIVIPLPNGLQSQLDELTEKMEKVKKEAEDAYNQIAQLSVAGKDIKEQKKIYQDSMDSYDQMQVDYKKILAKALNQTKETTDEIYARLEQGESFEDLMKAFGSQDHLYYHKESNYWVNYMKEAAMTLKNPGDVSQPTLASDGIHILYYAEDIHGGKVEMNEEQTNLVKETLIQRKFGEELQKLTDAWKKDYKITVHMDQLTY